MASNVSLGNNRTGIATSNDLAKRMLAATREFLPNSVGNGWEVALVREDYLKRAPSIGSVPPPMGIGSLVKAAAQGLLGRHPVLLLDKLGERLAFERTGVRLYEALISKFDADGGLADGPSRKELETIMAEEYGHVGLLAQAMSSLGGDPTAITPSANLQAVLSKGILEVAVDPRIGFAQSLEALLMAELADNEGWETLADLAEQNGEFELGRKFVSAREVEETHLERVRSWVAISQKRPADD